MTLRIILIIAAIAGVGLLVAQAYMNKSVADTEQQPYTVLQELNGLETRFYPEAVLATVRSETNGYKASSNRHFRVLAGYIFGGNEAQQSIAMTTPVHMKFDASGSEMSFVMPSDLPADKLPKPNDGSVRFEQTGSRYVVALRFGGWADDKCIRAYTDELLEKAAASGLKVKGQPWFMAYNPPFQLTDRRNEVAVEIEQPTNL
jgi:hypothetical protein